MIANKTVCLEARMDIKVYAALLRFYQGAGVIVPHKSTVISLAMEDLLNVLVQNDKAAPFGSIEEAARYVEDRFDIRQNKSRKQLMEGLAIESLVNENDEMKRAGEIFKKLGGKEDAKS